MLNVVHVLFMNESKNKEVFAEYVIPSYRGLCLSVGMEVLLGEFNNGGSVILGQPLIHTPIIKVRLSSVQLDLSANTSICVGSCILADNEFQNTINLLSSLPKEFNWKFPNVNNQVSSNAD